jgi:hypothetical protein
MTRKAGMYQVSFTLQVLSYVMAIDIFNSKRPFGSNVLSNQQEAEI